MPLDYKQVLVAVDGSKEARFAFRKAIGIAKRNNATLHLATIVDYRSLPGNKVYDHSIMENARENAEKLLSGYRNEAHTAGVTQVNIIIDFGSPKHMIPKDIAKRVQADLIVCGAAGLNRFERFMLGSVSQHIVRASKCDVLVVRTEEAVDASEREGVGPLS